ncbi:helix-turn-helix transcriptional regulator [Microbacterium jejuense]|uniref:Helix-turn-helix transcriptional regulator n=1 Tax=Microbacterium jejuense TaxID=1263637 RepID=A0ABS7HSJ0_9MICO|nr:helix-turn-helix transcriptional regulator [Microbacterium jejuense]MBW9095172.1 helix-turn-helix transcriptional regulator [Microbacterium jejuense]
MTDVGALSRAVARILVDACDELFVTQTELARRSGVSQSQISKLLRAEREIKLGQLDAICAALGLSIVAVVAEATNPEP